MTLSRLHSKGSQSYQVNSDQSDIKVSALSSTSHRGGLFLHVRECESGKGSLSFLQEALL